MLLLVEEEEEEEEIHEKKVQCAESGSRRGRRTREIRGAGMTYLNLFFFLNWGNYPPSLFIFPSSSFLFLSSGGSTDFCS